jgi:uncharacterized membrane protein YvbJ
MFCVNCGNKVKEGANFCDKCGTPVGAAQPAPPTYTQPIPPPPPYPTQQIFIQPPKKKHTVRNVFIAIAASFAVFIVVCLIIYSYGDTKQSMENRIWQSFQEKLDTDSAYEKYGMKVQNVSLVKAGSNSYNGYVTVLLGNKTHDVSITVTKDGDSFMYETDPLAFAFLIGYELENLFSW